MEKKRAPSYHNFVKIDKFEFFLQVIQKKLAQSSTKQIENKNSLTSLKISKAHCEKIAHTHHNFVPKKQIRF